MKLSTIYKELGVESSFDEFIDWAKAYGRPGIDWSKRDDHDDLRLSDGFAQKIKIKFLAGDIFMQEFMISGVDFKRTKSKEDWIEFRKSRVGGSDVGTLLGKNPFSSPAIVFAEKMGIFQKEETDLMRRGSEEEKDILQKMGGIFYSKFGKSCDTFKSKVTYYNENAHANLDGICIFGAEVCGLEIKRTSQAKWSNPPEYYEYQCQHYMYVTGLKRFFLVAVGDSWENVFEIERNEEKIEEIKDICVKFKKQIDDKIYRMVSLDNKKALQALKLLNYHGFVEKKDFDFSEKDRLQELVDKYEILECAYGGVEKREQKRFNLEKFVKENPDLADKYYEAREVYIRR